MPGQALVVEWVDFVDPVGTATYIRTQALVDRRRQTMGRRDNTDPIGMRISPLRHIHLSLRVTHTVAKLLFGVLVLGAVLPGLLVARLSQGPLNLDFLTGRLEAALNTEGTPTRIAIGGIVLAWEGFHGGLDRPLDLRLRDVALVDEAGRKRLTVPHARATLSLPALLLGRVVPRAVELEGVRLTVTRGVDDTVAIDVGSLAEATDPAPSDAPDPSAMLAELMRPVGADHFGYTDPLSQLRRVRLRDLGLRIVDRALGTTWDVPSADFELTRRGGGGIDLYGTAVMAMKDGRTTVTVSAVSSSDLETVRAKFSLGAIVPAVLGLASLDALDAPVSAEGTIEFSRALAFRSGTLTVGVGAGRMRMGEGTLPIRSASATVSGRSEAFRIDAGTLVLPGADGRPDTVLSLSGSVKRGATRLAATLNIGLDRLGLADLPRLWPVGVGGGARPWLTENMTDGLVRDGRLTVGLEANSDFSGVALTQASGSLDADNVSVHWLRPVPPAERGQARIRLIDADTIDIVLTAGQQRVGTRAPIVLTGGTMRIVGLSEKDQDAEIALQANGPLADVIALLKEPRLKLLSAHPVDLREPSGEATVSLKIVLPLENRMTLDDVEIGATSQLRQGHLTGVAAGRDLEKGDLEIAANKKQLTFKGTGQIGGIAAKIDGLMDFQAGRPKDVAQRIAVAGKPSVAQLNATGLDTLDLVSGDIPMTAVWSKLNNGEGDIVVEADLTGAILGIEPLAWAKPAGRPAKASARLVLAKDRLSSIDNIVVEGTELSMRGVADVVGGRIAGLRVDRAQLGRNELAGSIRIPQGGPIGFVLNGPSLDLAAKVVEKPPSRDKSKPEPPPGPAWTLTGSFGRVLLANAVEAQSVRVEAANDGRIFQRLRIAGSTQPAASFAVGIAAEKGLRRATATAADAGAFLRGLDAIHTMQGGALTLTGTFDDTNAAHALSGMAEITDFRVRGAPALGKLLQAMTLYGLVDVVSGPGLGFSTLTAPFVLLDDDLELRDARAFSPSLGMTVKGHLDMHAEIANIEGTIVPAYFFNSLLGKIPLFGGVFRGEEGGGLFAARYTIKGSLNDPSVFVNPLSMLTPGFLRGIFGIF